MLNDCCVEVKLKVENMASTNNEESAKRKANPPDENDDSCKKKKLSDFAFSEIEFKLRLRDDETITSGLEDFVNVAVAHSDGVKCTDIVSRYCTSSPDCTELLGLLDITQKKLSLGQVTLVFECLTHILRYIQSDVNKFRSSGESVVQRILSAHLGQMYNYLRDQNKSKTVKKTLQLLISMVMLSDKAKKAVQSRFNFDHEMFFTLFQRRDRQDPENVRSSLVLFTMSFIVEGDGELINSMVQQKGFIQMTLAGLLHDPKEMVLDVLATFLDKVVKNPDVSKTAKIRLFSEKVLKQMCDLYEWEGPQGWRPKKDRKQDKSLKEFLTDEDFLEERALVVEMVHEFLLTVCTSQKHGIIFFDKTVGTGPRNFNQLLTHLLQSISPGLEHPLKRNLAVHILKSCPDQLFHFLSPWGNSLTARWSDKWVQNMNFLVEVYENLAPVPSFLSNPDVMVKDVNDLVSIMSVYFLPSHKIASSMVLSVKSDDLRVRHHCLLLMQMIIQKCNMVLSTISSKGLGELLSSIFKALVIKTLPSATSLFACVEKVLETLSSPKRLEAIGVEVDLVDHIAVILKTVKLYQSLCPNLLSERPKDVAKLVEAVGKMQCILDETWKEVEMKTDSKAILPQLDLLKLLSETDAKTLSLGREGLLEKLLRSAHQCSKEKHKEETISLVCKMLTSLDVLSSDNKELQMWIDLALTYETEMSNDFPSFSSIGFLSVCLCTLINNPMPFLDRAMEVVADATSANGEEDMNVSLNDGLKEVEIQEILKIKEEDLKLSFSNELAESSSPTSSLPFSPLSLIALDKLQYCKGDSSAMKEFVSAILVKILHTQANPVPYSVLVNCSKSVLCEGVPEYFEYWEGKRKGAAKTVPQVKLKMSVPFSCRLLNWFMSGDDSQQYINMEDVQDIPYEEKLICMNQAIFYMEHCLSPNFGLGLKIKRVKVLREVIENLFSSFVKESVSNSTKMETEETEDLSTEEKDVVEKISKAVLCILNNSTFKNLFLSTNPNTSSPSKSEKSKKLHLSLSKLLSNILIKCKDLKLSTSCDNVLKDYLDKSLENLLLEGDDEGTCLTTIESTACHLDLHDLNRCLCTFLKVPNASSIDGDISEDKQILKGQVAQPLTSLGQTFIQVLDLWMETIKPWEVVIKKGNSVVLAPTGKSTPKGTHLSNAHPESDNNSKNFQPSTQISLQRKPCDTTSILLDVSTFKSLFDFLPICSNFDAIICNIVKQLPHVGLGCSHKVFKSLIGSFSTLESNRQILVENMISSHDIFHGFGGNYLKKHINAVIKEGHFSLLRAYLEKPGGDAETIQIIGQKLLDSHKEILPCEDEHLWAGLIAFIAPDTGSGDAQCNDLCSAVRSYIVNSPSSAKIHHFSLLNAINKRQISLKSGLEQDLDFLETILKHLIFCLSKKTNRNIDLEEKLLHFCLDCLKCGNTLSSKFVSSSWAKFVKNSLKHLYNKRTLLDLLSKLSAFVYALKNSNDDDDDDDEEGSKRDDVNTWGGMSPQVVFEMCVSHTAFLPTLLSTSDIPVKDALINLLYTLFIIEPSGMKKELLNPFIGAYTASLSLSDQRLLKMMQVFLLESELDDTFPVLWGKAYLDHKANSKTLGPSLDTEIAMKVVLGEIDVAKMNKTVLHFAVRKNTKEFDVCDADELKSKPDCYDPTYILRVFLHILSPSKIVHVRSFVAKDCLGFLLISLTSHHLHCRLLAYQCLNEFYTHLENSGCPERHEFAFILDVLNASRVENGQKLSYVVALFLSRAVKLMLDPSDHMYLPILRFLTLKPEMDLNSVPEFYNLFFSAGIQYGKERNWMLSLLRDGIKDSTDYWQYQKRLIFRLLMSFYSSSVSDKTSQVLVLEIMRNACHLRSSAMDLVKEHGLILWLASVVSGLKERPEHTELVYAIISTLCSTLEATNYVTTINTEALKYNPLVFLGITESITEKQKEETRTNEDESSTLKTEDREGLEVPSVGIPESMVLSLDLLIKSLNWFLNHPPSVSIKNHFKSDYNVVEKLR